MEREYRIVNSKKLLYCNRCKKWLDEDLFNIDNSNLHNNKGNKCLHCKNCQIKKYKNYLNRTASDKEFALRRKLRCALNGAIRRSKKYNRYIDLNIDFLLYLWEKQKGKCAITGYDMTFDFYKGRVNSNVSLDRIDSSKGYTKDNVQLVCMAANQMKNDLAMDELINICQDIINYNNKSKGGVII